MKITILLSGSGTNFQAILDAIKTKQLSNVSIIKVIADRECEGINRAVKNNIPFALVSRRLKTFEQQLLQEIPQETDLIVLAGFLSILPEEIIRIYPKKIINIHPSLLPKYGGKGMYGMRVHKAVIDANDSESGCTVHFVDNGIDTGDIILQKKVNVSPNDTPQKLQKRVLAKEHQLLPEAIQLIVKKAIH